LWLNQIYSFSLRFTERLRRDHERMTNQADPGNPINQGSDEGNQQMGNEKSNSGLKVIGSLRTRKNAGYANVVCEFD
jgi:hypothetical protein